MAIVPFSVRLNDRTIKDVPYIVQHSLKIGFEALQSREPKLGVGWVGSGISATFEHEAGDRFRHRPYPLLLASVKVQRLFSANK